jgi:hypothetical protein
MIRHRKVARPSNLLTPQKDVSIRTLLTEKSGGENWEQKNIFLIMSALPPLSALAKFDDLMRCTKELTAGVAEESEFEWENGFSGGVNNFRFSQSF